MSGHSKWSSIKHKKGAADAKRGKLFSKLTRAIIVAAKEGGPDPAGNLALQNAVEKAKAASMPKDNIDRAIAKGTGEGADGAAYETVVYEGYGPEGVAVIVEALTDNRNRTASEVRHAFTKHGGSLGTTGAVAWQFERRGVVVGPTFGCCHDELLLVRAVGGHEHDAPTLELPGDRSGRAEVASELRERVSHLGGGAVPVVRQRLDEHGDALGPVALVDDRLEARSLGVGTRSLRDRPLDVVLGHRVGARLLDRVLEREIPGGITATLLCRDDDRP